LPRCPTGRLLRLLASLDHLDRSGELLPEFGGRRRRTAKDRTGTASRCVLPPASPEARLPSFFDGHEFRACRDAVTAIATVVKAKRPCTAIDLSAIRTGTAAE
jgi:hypothetical protein